jgi:hypothetical protein
MNFMVCGEMNSELTNSSDPDKLCSCLGEGATVASPRWIVGFTEMTRAPASIEHDHR